MSQRGKARLKIAEPSCMDFLNIYNSFIVFIGYCIDLHATTTKRFSMVSLNE